MKPSLLFTTLSLAFLSPVAFAKSELELLRDRCAEQERQIRLLEDENLKLRSLGERSRPGTTTTVSAPIPSAPAAPSPGTATYTIKAGDNLAKIARNHGTTPEALIRLNGIKDPLKIQPGQKLKLPGNTSTPSAAPSVAGSKTHRVASGETFYSIAKKHRITVDALIAANPKVNPASLRPGQVINLTPPAPAPQPVSAPKTNPAPATSPSAFIPVSTADPKPAPLSPTPQSDKTPVEKPVIRLVKIEGVTTYGEFATLHHTNVTRLNELNELDLSSSTVLAIGSELYVPAQP